MSRRVGYTRKFAFTGILTVGISALVWAAGASSGRQHGSRPLDAASATEDRVSPSEGQDGEPRQEFPDYASYYGPATVSRTPDGVWTLQLRDRSDPLEFKAVMEDGDFPSDTAIAGSVGVDFFDDVLRVSLDSSYANNTLFYEVELKLAETEARALGNKLDALAAAKKRATPNEADSTIAASNDATSDRFVEPSENESDAAETMDQGCAGGSCSCTGKCDACCPAGTVAECSCSGPGRCRCRDLKELN